MSPLEAEKTVVRLPAVLALLSFVAAAGVSIGISYATFSTHDDVTMRVDKAVAAHAAHVHVGAVTSIEFNAVAAELKEIKTELKGLVTATNAIKTDLAVVMASTGKKKH